MLAIAVAGGGIEVRDAGRLRQGKDGVQLIVARLAGAVGDAIGHAELRTPQHQARLQFAGHDPGGHERLCAPGPARQAPAQVLPWRRDRIGEAREGGGHGAIVVQRVDGAAQAGQIEIVDAWDRRRVAATLADDPGRHVLAVLRIARAAVGLPQQSHPHGLASQSVGQAVGPAGDPGIAMAIAFGGCDQPAHEIAIGEDVVGGEAHADVAVVEARRSPR